MSSVIAILKRTHTPYKQKASNVSTLGEVMGENLTTSREDQDPHMESMDVRDPRFSSVSSVSQIEEKSIDVSQLTPTELKTLKKNLNRNTIWWEIERNTISYIAQSLDHQLNINSVLSTFSQSPQTPEPPTRPALDKSKARSNVYRQSALALAQGALARLMPNTPTSPRQKPRRIPPPPQEKDPQPQGPS